MRPELISDASTGLFGSPRRSSALAIAPATSSTPATTGGTKSTISASTPGSARSTGTAVLVGRAGGRAEHVDRVGHGGLGGKRCLQSGLRLCREHREL